MIVSVVKVNCSSFAFNIIKQNVVIEEHQKYQKIVEKGCKVCTGRFVYFVQVMTSYQENIRLLTDDSSENAECK